MYTVCEHENFRRKPLKGNGRGRIREGKGPAWIFCPVQGPRVPSYATEYGSFWETGTGTNRRFLSERGTTKLKSGAIFDLSAA